MVAFVAEYVFVPHVCLCIVFACLCLSKKTCWKVVPSGGKFLVANFSGSRLKLFRESAAFLTLRQSSITNQFYH